LLVQNDVPLVVAPLLATISLSQHGSQDNNYTSNQFAHSLPVPRTPLLWFDLLVRLEVIILHWFASYFASHTTPSLPIDRSTITMGSMAFDLYNFKWEASPGLGMFNIFHFSDQ
jgi:hypothetical protein